MVLASQTDQVTTDANVKADQDCLHHWVGTDIHAPRREIAWQGRRADHRRISGALHPAHTTGWT